MVDIFFGFGISVVVVVEGECEVLVELCVVGCGLCVDVVEDFDWYVIGIGIGF